jgi:hypothetical protein
MRSPGGSGRGSGVSDNELTIIAGALLIAASFAGMVLAVRALRTYERDFGRQEGQGINGPAMVTTTVLIDTERIRAANRGLLILIGIIFLTTEPGGWSRLAMAGTLIVIAALEDYKSVLWARAQKVIAAYERTRRTAAGVAGHAAGVADEKRDQAAREAAGD